MNKRKKLVIVVWSLAIALILLIGVVILLERSGTSGKGDHTNPPTQAGPGETQGTIYWGAPLETPCGTIYVPDDWDEPIRVETVSSQPVQIDFFADSVKLYTLTFSDSPDRAMGFVSAEQGIVYVGMMLYDLEAPTDQLFSMQESVNALLEQLSVEPIGSISVKPEISGSELIIKTDYGSLVFPAKWEKELLVVAPNAHTLEFICRVPGHASVRLFTVSFGTDTGDITVKFPTDSGAETTLSITIAQIAFDDSWGQEDRNLVYAMQEDMNYLLDALQD